MDRVEKEYLEPIIVLLDEKLKIGLLESTCRFADMTLFSQMYVFLYNIICALLNIVFGYGLL